MNVGVISILLIFILCLYFLFVIIQINAPSIGRSSIARWYHLNHLSKLKKQFSSLNAQRDLAEYRLSRNLDNQIKYIDFINRHPSMEGHIKSRSILEDYKDISHRDKILLGETAKRTSILAGEHICSQEVTELDIKKTMAREKQRLTKKK